MSLHLRQICFAPPRDFERTCEQFIRVLGVDPADTARRWAALTGCALEPTGLNLHFGGKFVEFRKPGADMTRWAHWKGILTRLKPYVM